MILSKRGCAHACPLFFCIFLLKHLANCELMRNFASIKRKHREKMKKWMMLLALVSMTITANAQEEETLPGNKHSVMTNSFWANWEVQLAGTTRGGALALGKWFTPGIGLRTKLNIGQMNKYGGQDKRDKYLSLNEQVMLNVTNMVIGYNERRIWNVIPYFGGGLFRDMSLNKNGIQWSYGLLNTFRINKRFTANLEAGCNRWDAGTMGVSDRKFKNQWTVEVGLTYKLGRCKWDLSPDMESVNALTQGEVDALNAQVNDLLEENARLQEQLDSKNGQQEQENSNIDNN